MLCGSSWFTALLTQSHTLQWSRGHQHHCSFRSWWFTCITRWSSSCWRCLRRLERQNSLFCGKETLNSNQKRRKNLSLQLRQQNNFSCSILCSTESNRSLNGIPPKTEKSKTITEEDYRQCKFSETREDQVKKQACRTGSVVTNWLQSTYEWCVH